MRTHELADTLTKLAEWLKQGPNLNLDEFLSRPQNYDLSKGKASKKKPGTAASLNALLSISEFEKSDLLDLAAELGLSVDFRPRDAARDILGKVLKALESQPEARAKLQHRATDKESSGSPELAKALSVLLGR